MKILLIDTCGAQGSATIADASAHPAKLASAVLPGRSASEKLVGTIRALAAQSGAALRELDAVAVVNGPGSFTGVRVGLSAAKGLCDALGLPLIAISRLQVLASMAGARPGVPVFPALDAGRGEFYLGEYVSGDRIREGLASREELAGLFTATPGEPILAVCEEQVAAVLAEFAPRMVAEPDAAAALPLALQRIERGEFDDVATVDANYLRRTDLEIFAKVKAGAGAVVLKPGDRA